MAERRSPDGANVTTISPVSSIPNLLDLLSRQAYKAADGRNSETLGVSRENGGRLEPGGPETPVHKLAEQLEKSSLDESDLEDLNAHGSAFPETDTQPETESGYPISGQASSFLSMPLTSCEIFDSSVQGFSRERGTVNPSAIVENGELLELVPNNNFFVTGLPRYCVDVRKQPAGLHSFTVTSICNVRRDMGPLHSDFKSVAAEFFSCPPELIHVVQRKRAPHMPLFIIGADINNLHFIVDHKDHEMTGCLVATRDTNLSVMLDMCQQWLERNHAGHTSRQICLLHNGRRLDQAQGFPDLKDFEEIELVKSETVTLKFLCRVNHQTERSYFVECEDIDYIREVKDKFLQAFSAEENDQNAIGAIDTLWLTYKDKIVADGEILRTLWTQRNVDEFSREFDAAEDLTFHVHVKPTDAVLVKLNFKSDLRRSLKSESVILLSPRARVEEMRKEIAKTIHKEASSFKIFISGKKIEMDTVLEPFLRSPNCIVVVEQRPKIQLSVVDVAANESFGGFSVSLHRYERVERLKQEVCRQLEVPSYCVDLKHNTSTLQEQNDLRTSRLRHGDTVNALLLPNRIRLSVRLASNQWEDVVVDDVTVSTVEQLKGYVEVILMKRFRQQQTRRQSTPGPEETTHAATQQKTFVTSVIVKGILPPDGSTLREAGVEMNCRVVVIQEEKLCYTVDPPGRVPLFLGAGVDNYQPPQRVIAMTDGKEFYFKNNQDTSSQTPMLFPSLAPHHHYPGIGQCSRQLQAQFPQRQQNVTCPPLGSDQQKSYVCHMCKSESMPNFPSTPWQGRGINHSQSDTFQKVSRYEHVQMEASEESFQNPKHSTPMEGSQGGGYRALDLSDATVQPMPSAAASHSNTAMSTPNRVFGPGSYSMPAAAGTGQGTKDQNKLSLIIGKQSGQFVDPQHPQQAGGTDHRMAFQQTSLQQGSMTHTNPWLSTPNTAGSENQCPQTPFDWTNKSGCPSGYQSESGTFPRHRNRTGSSSTSGLRSHGNFNTESPNITSMQAHGAMSPDYQNLQMMPFTPTDRTRHPSGYCSESGASRRSNKSALHYEATMEESPIGHRKYNISLDMDLETAKSASNTFAHFPWSPFPSQGAVPALTGPGGHPNVGCSQQLETTFTYIKKEIIWFLAKQLGREGPRVMSQLLPDCIISEAEHRHPNDICQRFYYCLQKWCQINGSKATVKDLTHVLEANERKDLAEDVERMAVEVPGSIGSPPPQKNDKVDTEDNRSVGH